ncbi:MAG: hypothetical protein KDM64_03320, partial [Verrucomicrobiae bacterium]|nr:hypothetical protein [Verrucomicrobiae bacterium]
MKPSPLPSFQVKGFRRRTMGRLSGWGSGVAGVLALFLVVPWTLTAIDYDGDTVDDDPYQYDTDGDGYTDGEEYDASTDPYDSLSYPGSTDPNYYYNDPYYMDSDVDGYSDGAEIDSGTDPYNSSSYPGSDPYTTDTDGDGYSDYDEINNYNTDPNDPNSNPSYSTYPSDSDGDGWTDIDENSYGTNPYDSSDYPGSSSGYTDPEPMDDDGDGLTNDEEASFGTNPNLDDTDGDGLSDYAEVNGITLWFTDPVSNYYYDYTYYTDPLTADTDGDLLGDGWELNNGMDPMSSSDGMGDLDGDGLTTGQEMSTYGTDYTKRDTDGDGESDGYEIEQGTIPTDILSRSTNDSDGDHMSDDWEIAHSLDPQVDDGDADPDHDDLTNYREYLWNADPRNPDSDGDGYPDGFERTHGFDPTEASDALTDSDNDELPDLWELTYLMNPSSSGDGSDDPDSDTLSNLVEFQSGTNPLKADTDGDGDPDDLELANQTNPLDRHDYTVVDDDNDGMHDRWETANGLNTSLNDADADDDQDGLSNAQEFQRGTRANSKDSDGDGYEDGFEVAQGYDPTSAADALFDSDGDGMTDLWELTYGLNINDPTDADGDTDSDGISNGDEFAQGTDPGVANGGSNGNGNGTMVDADGDGMSDTWEILNGLNQFDSSDASRDFDYDRISNLQEFLDGTSPNTNWTLQEVPLSGGVIGGVSTLNEMGELVRLNNGSLTVFRWEGDQWVDRGQFGGGVTVNALKQNNFGMTVGWNNGLGTAASQARVRNLNTGEVDSIAPLDAQSLKVLKVTDSGFVIGEFKGSDGRKRLFRYRNGYTDLLENPAGNLEYRDSNSVGQILAHFGSPNDVRAFIKDEWVAGVAPGAMKISDSGGFTSVSAGSPPLSLWRWFSNQQGDLVTGVIPGSISGVPPVHEGLFSANGGSWVLFDPVIPDPEHYARHVVPMGLSESGD